MRTATKICLPALFALSMAACSTAPTTPAPASDSGKPEASLPASASPASPAATASGTMPASTVATVSLPEYLDPKNPLSSERSVYFDFDEFAVRPSDAALIERHGKFLAGHPAVAIRIEGNTDERGGIEYNLALGQKRAEAVLRALRIYGVSDRQVEATSWGESKPRALGHDEAAWAQNRRVDLQYPPK